MNKLLSLVVAVALSIVGTAAAYTMPVAFPGQTQTGLITPIADRAYSGSQPRYSRGHHQGYRYGYYASPYGLGQANFCPFGSYVACVYSGIYCWNRCY
jgi:hypothetical protein